MSTSFLCSSVRSTRHILLHTLGFDKPMRLAAAVSNRKLESVPPLNSKARTQHSSPTCEPTPSVADTRIIFLNILLFYLTCSSQVIEEGGKGMGEVFLEMVLLLAPPYMTYITVHPWALAHLDVLSSPS
ncbi:hypothetical protein DEU56DRAFT_985477 [Suillus clintonianus]|uniref:uncharacterized protein n=1 Tax=Suillus clintonianus TaxID=1904413 RepID=UPI001B8737F3|nr:uncharacterized protein DEU56DRAFT_985477 [Suillus clintonianus]KAG2107814.1 hypothetical protein DEU56DRAFT_985477 [Suillus clintonianus]